MFSRDAVDYGGFDLSTVGAEIRIAEIIGHDQKKIRPRAVATGLVSSIAAPKAKPQQDEQDE